MSKAKTKPSETAPPEGEDVDDVAAGKKKPPLMVIIAAGVGALVVLGGGGTGAMLLLGGKGAQAQAQAEKKPKAKPHKKEAGKDGKDVKSPITEGPDGVVFYAMPDIGANIQSPDGHAGYLKLKLSFELPDEAAADAIEPNAPRLNDMFQGFLRELRPEDLSGSAGSYQLRMEILRRVNLVIAPAKINAVLIQEMLIS